MEIDVTYTNDHAKYLTPKTVEFKLFHVWAPVSYSSFQNTRWKFMRSRCYKIQGVYIFTEAFMYL